ncbi:hypothetical protein CYMTET_53398, partial [Cymbomonas tetramitiformis]
NGKDDDDDEEEWEEVEEEVEVEEVVEREPITVKSVAQQVPTLVQNTPVLKNGLIFAGGLLATTFLWSCFQVYKKYTTPRAKRKRTVSKNRLIVDTLDAFLPSKRTSLNPGELRKLSRTTGFSPDLVFRKYLRYLLDQRPFDPDAVSDVLVLRAACGLTDEQIKEVLRESAKRGFERTGILMISPTGMTAEGLLKKAGGRALFSKLMYFSDMEELLPSGGRDELQLEILEIFGATSEDYETLRIKTLSEADTAALEALMGRREGDGDTWLEAADAEDKENDNDEDSDEKNNPELADETFCCSTPEGLYLSSATTLFTIPSYISTQEL